MKVITINTNGIRAAAKKGFFQWLKKEDPDFVCIQETKAQIHQLDDPQFSPEGYHCFHSDAEKKGYSGVAVYSKVKPKKVVTTLGWPIADTEGRYVELQFDGLRIASIYVPSGSSSEDRQVIKMEFLKHYQEVLKKQIKHKDPMIICGDFNVVHKEIDIKNFKSNQKSSGCLPEERAWLDLVFDKIGFVDGFRVVNHKALEYTWWSSRGQARNNNVGWRIDYQMLTPDLASRVRKASIYKAFWFSDHAPVVMEYDFSL